MVTVTGYYCYSQHPLCQTQYLQSSLYTHTVREGHHCGVQPSHSVLPSRYSVIYRLVVTVANYSPCCLIREA